MKKEIERRFLVDQNKLPSLKHGKLITQGYLAKLNSEISPIVRVRAEGKSAYLTIKLFESLFTKKEFEYKIPLKEAELLLQSCIAQVQKIRYSVKITNHVWVIDQYEGENFPLIVAEVELKNETEKFELPLWVTKEVSQDSRFHAYNLAIKPYSVWKNQLTR